MEGTISSFRRTKHSVHGNHMIVIVPSLKNREAAAKLIGKTVKYNTGKKDMIGKVQAAHGNKGALRVLFETGMPGQALGQKVIIE